MSRVPIVWVFGGPGCGKSTQCEKVVEKYGFKHVKIEDLLQAEIASNSDKGYEIKALMCEGKDIPYGTIIVLLFHAIRNEMCEVNGFLVECFPRETEDGGLFERMIAPVDIIIYLECSDATMVKRIKSGRSQKLPENRGLREVRGSTKICPSDEELAQAPQPVNQKVIKNRIVTFRKNLKHVSTQYTKQIMTIDAERSVEDIFVDVERVIDCLLEKKAKPMDPNCRKC